MKKILVLVLVLALLLPAAGLAFNETGYPISDEVVTITVAGRNAATLDWNDTDMVAELEKRMGIKLECTSYEGDIWQTQLTLMFASDELPDLILSPNITLEEVAEYGAQGYLLDMKDLIEKYAPNIKAAAEKYPSYMNYCTSPDGGVYTLCQINPNVIAQISRCWLNKTWMDNLGLEYPTTIEALHDVLTAFKEQDANGNGDPSDEIPMAHLSGYDMLTNLMTAFGIYSYGSGNTYLLQADAEGKVFLADTTENYKAFLTWMNQLWNEGLIDVDNFVNTEEEFRGKVAADTVGMFGDAAPFVSAGKNIDFDQNFYWIGGLTSEWNETPTIVKSSSVSASPKILVSATTEHAEEIIRLLDYFFTDEGCLTGSLGFEGVSYDMEYSEIPGLESYGIAKQRQPEGWASGEEYRYKKAIINEGFNIIRQFAGTQYPMILAANDEQLEQMLPLYGWAVRLAQDGIDRCTVVDTFPGLLYNEDESTTRTQLYTDIKLYLNTMQAQFITGQVNLESDWDAYLKQLDTMGLSRLLEIEQAAYDRLLGK